MAEMPGSPRLPAGHDRLRAVARLAARERRELQRPRIRHRPSLGALAVGMFRSVLFRDDPLLEAIAEDQPPRVRISEAEVSRPASVEQRIVNYVTSTPSETRLSALQEVRGAIVRRPPLRLASTAASAAASPPLLQRCTGL